MNLSELSISELRKLRDEINGLIRAAKEKDMESRRWVAENKRYIASDKALARRKEAYDKYASGMTFRAIGLSMGCGVERARSLVRTYETRLRMKRS